MTGYEAGELVGVVDRAPAEDPRTAKIAGLRELAGWLEANPKVPLPHLSTFAYYPQNHGSDTTAAALAELRRLAAVLGVEPSTPHGTGPGNHVYVFGPTFRGGLSYEVAVCDAAEDFARGAA